MGIIYNSFAGFMLAPEILGVKRVNRAGQFIENLLALFIKRIEVLLPNISLRGGFIDLAEKSALKEILESSLWLALNTALYFYVLRNIYASIIVYDWTWALNNYQNLYILYLLAEIASAINFKNDSFKTIAMKFGKSFYSAFIDTITRPYYLTKMAVYLFLTLFLLYPSQFVLTALIGHKQLKNALVWWGIWTFIIGNVFQLWATFAEKP